MSLITSQRGFLLVEALIAIVVITVALVAIQGMFIQSLQATASAANYTVAAGLVQEQMEQMKIKDELFWNSLSFPYQSATEVIAMNKATYTRTTQAELSPLDPEYPVKQRIIKVTVKVEWLGAQNISMVTYVLRELPQFAD